MELHNSNDNRRDNVEFASQIIAEYGDFIWAIAFAEVKNRDQADDIFQDFFLSLVSKPIPNNVNNVKGYLYRAINNDIADATRRVQKYRAHINKYSQKTTYSINKSNSKNALEEEQINRMFDIIKEQLPRSSAQAIILRYRDGQNTKEVAEKMGVKSKSISRYISTGLKKIRQHLAGK
jgi:RNA polymerase sigma-70 factor (ECF subfamily)